jgi:hypothetical protein
MITWSDFYDIRLDDFFEAWRGSEAHSRVAVILKENLRKTLQAFLASDRQLEWYLSFFDLLFWMEARDVKDKAYAVYPILELLGFDLREPDYSKPYELIYEELTSSLIKKSGSLEVLREATRMQNSTNRHLPSWVPDWATNLCCFVQWEPPLVQTYEKELYERSNELYETSTPLLFPAPGQIEIYGQPLCLVHSRATRDFATDELEEDKLQSLEEGHVLTRFEFYHDRRALFRASTWREWIQLSGVIDPRSKNYLQYESLFNILTLVSNSVPYDSEAIQSLVSLWGPLDRCPWDLKHARAKAQSLEARDTSSSTSWTANIRSALISALALEPIQNPDKGVKLPPRMMAIAELLTKLRICQQDRAFFLTDDGSMGTCFYTVKDGDLVVLFKGTREPFVLRQENECYRVISTAYIPSLIDLEKPLEDDLSKMQKFTLV